MRLDQGDPAAVHQARRQAIESLIDEIGASRSPQAIPPHGEWLPLNLSGPRRMPALSEWIDWLIHTRLSRGRWANSCAAEA